jgi:hypothetical protein
VRNGGSVRSKSRSTLVDLVDEFWESGVIAGQTEKDVDLSRAARLIRTSACPMSAPVSRANAAPRTSSTQHLSRPTVSRLANGLIWRRPVRRRAWLSWRPNFRRWVTAMRRSNSVHAKYLRFAATGAGVENPQKVLDG